MTSFFSATRLSKSQHSQLKGGGTGSTLRQHIVLQSAKICQGWLVPFQCSIADAAGTQSASDCEVLRGAKWDTGCPVQLLWRSLWCFQMVGRNWWTRWRHFTNMGIIWVWVLNLGPLHDMGWLWMASYFEGQRVNRSIGSDILTRMVTRLRFRVCRVKASWMPRCAVTPRLQTAVKLWRLGLAGNHLELQVSSSPVYPKTFGRTVKQPARSSSFGVPPFLVTGATPLRAALERLPPWQRHKDEPCRRPRRLRCLAASDGDMDMDQNPPGTPQILAYFWN